jgi:hypothetical protein
VEKCRALYRPFIEWSEPGILHDLKRFHNVEKPKVALLLAIASGVAQAGGMTMTRDVRRRRDLLIGWINSNYDRFRGIIEEITIAGDEGPTLTEQVQALALGEVRD